MSAKRQLVLSAIGAGILIAAIVQATFRSPFLTGLERIVAEPWGVVTLIDLYAGIFVIWAWIWVREPNRLVALGWLALLIGLGNLATMAYLMLAAARRLRAARLFASSSSGA